jgi:RTX calcium-binding nonapeptide repeat (4 copies)
MSVPSWTRELRERAGVQVVGIVTAIVAAVGCAPVATPVAAAATSNRCSFDRATRVVDVTLSPDEEGVSTLVVVRADGVVEPRFYVPRTYNGTTAPIPCGSPAPTVTTVDTIRVRTQPHDDPARHWLRLVEEHRPFAPGATPEPGGMAEIELDVDLGTHPESALIVHGRGDAAKSYAVGSLGVALNADDDLDVALAGSATVSLDAGLGSGTSRFTGQGGFGTGAPTSRTLYLSGARSSGDNTIVGGQGDDHLGAGGGNDTVRGAGGDDDLVDTTVGCCGGAAGGGRDVLDGGPGDDGISAYDYLADQVDGGPGTDLAQVDPRLDVVRNVESVR